MFYAHVETEKKKRVHFHGFMLDVHKSKFALCLYWAAGELHRSTKTRKWCLLSSVLSASFAPNSRQGADELALSAGGHKRMSEYSTFSMMAEGSCS